MLSEALSGVVQKLLAEQKALWMKFSEVQDEVKEQKLKLDEGKQLLQTKKKEQAAAQAPLR